MRGVRLVSVLAAAIIVTGCADDEPERGGEVTVLAAASLTEPFEALGERLAEDYPDLDVTFSFGPSSGLVEQVIAGAPADVLATANTATMDNATAAGMLAAEPQVFARNQLALAVPAGNPGEVTGLVDLARGELRIALCEPHVPCGAATAALLDAAGVDAAADTLTTDVKETVALLTLGEADAGLIYRTDAVAADDAVEVVEVAESDSVVNDYPIGVLAEARNPEGAQMVVDAVVGELGRDVLGEAGFLVP